MSLVDQINLNASPYSKWYQGPIPKTIPAINADRREVAGGTFILQQILNVLESGDEGRIKDLESDYAHTSDGVFTFEDEIKTQLCSPFLMGIKGVVDTSDGPYIAVNAKSVQDAIENGRWKYFKPQLSKSEGVRYTVISEREQREIDKRVRNVVLFPYDGISMKLNADQWVAIPVDAVDRKDITCGCNLEQKQVVDKDDRVISYPLTQYPPEIIVPVVKGGKNDKGQSFKGVFKYNEDKDGGTKNLGFFLADPPTDRNAEMRALYVGGLGGGLGLCGDCGLGGGGSRLVGVDARRAAQKFDPAYVDVLHAIRSGAIVLCTPNGDYVKSAGKLHTEQKR